MAVQDGRGDDPDEQSNRTRYLAKRVLKSSVVLHAVYGHIRCPSTCDVVLGKETSLELVVISEDGIVQSVCEQPVFGSIKDLQLLPWNESRRSSQLQANGKDLLVLSSDSGKLSFLTFSVDQHRFLAVSHINIAHPGNMRGELGRLLAVESRGLAVAVSAFEDRLAIFPTSLSSGSNVVDKRINYPREQISSTGSSEESTSGMEENQLLYSGGNIWSMTFVGMPDDQFTRGKSENHLLLAVLVFRLGASCNELRILMCNTKERIIQLKARYDLSYFRPWMSTLGQNILDVPAAPGYLLLSRAGELLLFDLREPSNPVPAGVCTFSKNIDEEGRSNSVAASALLELISRGRDGKCKESRTMDKSLEVSESDDDPSSLPSINSWKWEPNPEGPPRLALAMDTGDIHLAHLKLLSPSGVPQIDILQHQHKCSPCNVLLWAKGGLLALFVEMGDGQVLQCTENGILNSKSYVQVLAPIIDFTLVDYYGEKQEQMFACCGAESEGSIRVIRNGISVDKLHTTSPVYQGVTGTYTMRMSRKDPYHAFFVMSFVQETRVLRVGINFVDITEAVGFQPWVSTLACGTIEDNHVVQVCSKEVILCSPTKLAHPAGLDSPLPVCSSWKPLEGHFVSLGAVAHKTIILALSKPGLIVMLGCQKDSRGAFELVNIQYCLLAAELSCISIPDDENWTSSPLPPSIVGLVDGTKIKNRNPSGVEMGRICVVGTHKPSVEVLSIVPGRNFAPLAVGSISLVSNVGTSLSGCVPESVRLAQFDGLYILAGLRNGMLLRYEWPATSTFVNPGPSSVLKEQTLGLGSSHLSADKTDLGTTSGQDGWEGLRADALHLAAVRRIGVSPISLIALQDSLRSDVVVLSDKPWLLQTARQSQCIAYTSISFPSCTHAAPVSSIDCLNGILFVADCSIHLVEMEHLKRLNVQKLSLGRTPRRVLYHSDSKTLLVMRTDNGPDGTPVSDICCVDPLSGTLHSCHTLENGEVARSIALWKYGNDQLLLVGTSLTAPGMSLLMPTGEAESAKGRILVFQLETRNRGLRNQSYLPSSSAPSSSNHPGSSSSGVVMKSDSSLPMDESDIGDGDIWQLRFRTHVVLPGVVNSISSYLGQYVLASAGNCLFCLGVPSESSHRLRKISMVRTRFMITTMTVYLTRIAVGDCRDGVLFYTYHEVTKRLEQLYCDPMRRLVADCVFTDLDTALVTDRLGNFCSLSCPITPEESVSPERNLVVTCWYHVGEILRTIKKASFAYEIPTSDSMKSCGSSDAVSHSTHSSVVATSLLGSVYIFIKVTREEYDLLEAVQTRLAQYPLTSPLLGNCHNDFRSRGCPTGVCKVLDGDMLCQFLELTSTQQECVLSDQQGVITLGQATPSSTCLERSTPVDHVLQLLERVHNSLA